MQHEQRRGCLIGDHISDQVMILERDLKFSWLWGCHYSGYHRPLVSIAEHWSRADIEQGL